MSTTEVEVHCPVCGQGVVVPVEVIQVRRNWGRSQLEIVLRKSEVAHVCPT